MHRFVIRPRPFCPAADAVVILSIPLKAGLEYRPHGGPGAEPHTVVVGCRSSKSSILMTVAGPIAGRSRGSFTSFSCPGSQKAVGNFRGRRLAPRLLVVTGCSRDPVFTCVWPFTIRYATCISRAPLESHINYMYRYQCSSRTLSKDVSQHHQTVPGDHLNLLTHTLNFLI
uniref:Uncharacterized protein n=1 Tax=Gasterosteus aculeatus TaxID=69293 RepID=G3Q7E6_GASAC